MLKRLLLLITTSLALFSMTFAQKPKVNFYPTDTVHVNKGYTVGHRLIVNTFKDSAGEYSQIVMYPRGDSSRFVYVCLTQPVEIPWLIDAYMRAPAENAYLDSLRRGRGFFKKYSDQYILFYIKDSINDTMMVVWSGGRFWARVTAIGLGDTPYNYASYCILEPLEKVEKPPSAHDILLVFRRGYFYDGPIYGYHKIELKMKYPKLSQLSRSVFDSLWNKRGEDFRYNDTFHCKPEYSAYDTNPNGSSDSVFIFMKCNLNLEDGADFSYLYLASKNDNKWMMEQVSQIYHTEFTFGFGIDFDNNGIPEFIGTLREFDACMGSLFIKSDGSWTSEYIDCL